MNLISNRDLYDLVKSLSKSEKRFLKLTASASDLNPNLITLFNTIETASDFKEDFYAKTAKSKTETLQTPPNHSKFLPIKAHKTPIMQVLHYKFRFPYH